jgi:molecular chaperone DnaJ
MDLYQVLQLRRDASADEIERSYRRLARRYHPGVNPGDRLAEELYRQVQSAYGVLGDPDRRREYDLGGAAGPALAQVEATVSFQGFDFSATAEGPQAGTFSELFADVFHDAARRATAGDRGLEIDADLRLSFEDAIRGGQFPISVARHDRCPACAGDGRQRRAPSPCPHCAGQGTLRWARGHMVFAKSCERCDGSGRLTLQTCATCGGAGVAVRSEVVTVSIPPGAENGARLVVPGRGHSVRGGATGDLYVTLQVGEHPYFQRRGRNLELRLPVAVHEAALGARVDVPTLEGAVRLKIPPGTQSGQRFRISGKGVPPAAGRDHAPGDLLVEIQIVLPPITDEQSKELLRAFGRLNDSNVREHLFGN